MVPATTMGAIASKSQYERVLRYIETAKAEGARFADGAGSGTNIGAVCVVIIDKRGDPAVGRSRNWVAG